MQFQEFTLKRYPAQRKRQEQVSSQGALQWATIWDSMLSLVSEWRLSVRLLDKRRMSAPRRLSWGQRSWTSVLTLTLLGKLHFPLLQQRRESLTQSSCQGFSQAFSSDQSRCHCTFSMISRTELNGRSFATGHSILSIRSAKWVFTRDARISDRLSDPIG